MEYTVSNHRHFADFTIIPNDILHKESLSFFEKGLLCYLLSLPCDWEIKIGVIATQFQESERAILKGMKGLIDVGYCRRTAKRSNGKLSGQHYQITDIANDFSAPTKNEGAEKTVAQISRPTEDSAPQENEGANKEYTLFKEESTIYTHKEQRESTRERKCLFADSKFYDFDRFQKQFTDAEFENVDLLYYYNRIKNWSGGNDKKKCDWILTAKNWMMDDNEAGKLKKIQPANEGLTPEAIEYLESMK